MTGPPGHGKSDTPPTTYLTNFINAKHIPPGQNVKIQGKIVLSPKMLQCN